MCVLSLSEATRYRQTTIPTKSERTHLWPKRVLTTLPLGSINQAHYRIDSRLVKTICKQVFPTMCMFNIGRKHLIE